jgi:YbbR domain-containing protein
VKLIRWIFENFWMKILALAIGVLIWLHVATEKIYTYEVTLPVSRIDLREHYTLANPAPDSVHALVSAKGKQLLRTIWRQQGVRIVATKLGIGENTLNLSPENTVLVSGSKNISIDEVRSPSPIELSIDLESSVELPILPLVTTTPDDGFAVSGKIEVSPSRALLTGPRSVVRNLKYLSTANRELSGLRSSLSFAVPLTLPAGVKAEVEPDSVQVTVQVVPVKTRVYENLPIVVYNTPPGMRVITSPARTRVEITGPPEDIDLLNRNSLTASVDFHAKSGIGFAKLKVDCPANFRVKRLADDSVRVLSATSADPGH